MAFKVSIAKSNSELVLALDLVCQVFLVVQMWLKKFLGVTKS